MEAFDERIRRGGDLAIQEASRFFMGTDPVHRTLHAIARCLEEQGIPYAVVGGMALVAHGYVRTTEDVDILVTPAGLDSVHKNFSGLGYVPLFAGSKSLRDTETGGRIEFITTGGYPGDGKPMPVAFPDPAATSTEIDGIHYIALPTLFELKLASGITNPGRLRDLADVQELIRVLELPGDYADRLNPYVRDKFTELWSAVQGNPHEPI